jgi:hypothetical protein
MPIAKVDEAAPPPTPWATAPATAGPHPQAQRHRVDHLPAHAAVARRRRPELPRQPVARRRHGPGLGSARLRRPPT